MELAGAIQQFDGSVAGLRVAVRDFDRGEAPVLYSYLESAAVLHRVAASWIIKAVLEQGGALDGARIFARLEREEAWEVILHLLQSVQYDPNGAAPWRDRVDAASVAVVADNKINEEKVLWEVKRKDRSA